jgi:hypothetical protein
MKKPKVKVGDLVEVKWLDIVWFLDIDQLDEEDFKNGGSTRYTVGYLAGIDKDKILISSELDGDRNPNRDFNIIPMGTVQSILLVRKNTFNGWGGVLPKKDKQ